MSEQAVVAESSSAPVVNEAPVMDVSRGPLVDITPEQRAEFRKTGNLPEPPKKTEEAATSSEAEKKAESVPASEADKQQDKPKPKQTAEERIAQLEATIEKIRKGAGQKEQPKADTPAPAKSEPKPVAEHPPTRPKPGMEDKDDKGNPKYTTYEDFLEDLSDWKSEQREVKNKREQQEQAQAKDFNDKIAKAESRYENFMKIAEPFAGEILGDNSISPVVKQMLRESDIMPDLIFTIGSSEKERADFLKMARENPGKALRFIALTESLINEELEGKPEAKPDPPAKPQTAAPKPPSEVGGRAASPGDALESAAKANDFRSFKAEANRRAIAKLKG